MTSPQLLVELLRLGLEWTIGVAIVMKSSYSEVVDVHPDSSTPVGWVVLCVVLDTGRGGGGGGGG